MLGPVVAAHVGVVDPHPSPAIQKQGIGAFQVVAEEPREVVEIHAV